ncbi:MAG: apolipoprotein N-acyltransferase [Bacteroidota bacterium]
MTTQSWSSKTRNINPWLLGLLSILLLCLCWPPVGAFWVLPLAFIPLLLAEDHFRRKGQSIWLYGLLCFLVLCIWNAVAAHWLFKTQARAAFIIYGANALMMALSFLIYSWVKLRKGVYWGLLWWVCCYGLYEWLTQSWELGYPLLSLSTALAPAPYAIQWIEVTGWLGATVWVLVLNGLLFLVLHRGGPSGGVPRRLRYVLLGSFLLPFGLSLLRWFTYATPEKSLNTLVLHTALDAYTVKYKMSNEDLLNHYFGLVDEHMTPEVELVVWPESALPNGGWLEDIAVNTDWDMIRSRMAPYPQSGLAMGAIFTELFQTTRLGPQSRYQHLLTPLDDGRPYFQYNAGIMLQPRGANMSFRTKQRRVPIEETLPYPNVLGPLQGFIGSLAGFKIAHRHSNQEVMPGPRGTFLSYVICYESLFGSVNRELVSQGAEVLVVGLNESWYENRIASKEFRWAAQLRAIENRRAVIRSANEGFSGYISPRGQVVQELQGGTDDALMARVPINDSFTLYTLKGDYLGWILVTLLIFSSVYTIWEKIRHK